MRHPSTFVMIAAIVGTAAPVLSLPGSSAPPLRFHIAPIGGPVLCDTARFTVDATPVAATDARTTADGNGGCDATLAVAHRIRPIRIVGVEMTDRSGRREFFSVKTAER